MLPGGKPVDVPTYAFQRKRFWLSPTGRADVTGAGLQTSTHPQLGAAVDLAAGTGDTTLSTGGLSLFTHPWLADHRVGYIVPGAALIELAASVRAIAHFTITKPLVVPDVGALTIQVVADSADITIFSRPEGGDLTWTKHDEELFAEIHAPLESDAGCAVHPALLDAGLHPLLPEVADTRPAALPFAWTGVRFHTGTCHPASTTVAAQGCTVRWSRTPSGSTACPWTWPRWRTAE